MTIRELGKFSAERRTHSKEKPEGVVFLPEFGSEIWPVEPFSTSPGNVEKGGSAELHGIGSSVPSDLDWTGYTNLWVQSNAADARDGLYPNNEIDDIQTNNWNLGKRALEKDWYQS